LGHLIFFYRNGYAEFKQIKTETIDANENKPGERPAKKAKLFITLTKSKDFEANMKKFNDIKLENEKNKPAASETKADRALVE
jgi:hypothetical protein